MAETIKNRRKLGIFLVTDGVTIYKDQRVLGISVDGLGATFTGNKIVHDVAYLAVYQPIYNEQPVICAVDITDGRTIYNGAPLLHVKQAAV